MRLGREKPHEGVCLSTLLAFAAFHCPRIFSFRGAHRHSLPAMPRGEVQGSSLPGVAQAQPAARPLPAATKARSEGGGGREAAQQGWEQPSATAATAATLPPRLPLSMQIPLERVAPLLGCAVSKWLKVHGKVRCAAGFGQQHCSS